MPLFRWTVEFEANDKDAALKQIEEATRFLELWKDDVVQLADEVTVPPLNPSNRGA